MRALKTIRALARRYRRVLVVLAVTALLGLWFLGYFGARGTKVGTELAPIYELRSEEACELSGLVASGRYPGVMWSHNDSGNAPRLFALTTEARILVPSGQGGPEEFSGIEVEGAKLVDWESIARADDKLYICDTGNNLSAREDLGVYVVKEPDPYQDSKVSVERFLSVRYPDQTGYPPTEDWRFDSEAAFCDSGYLYILTKERPPFRVFVQKDSTTLYRLDLKAEGEIKALEKVDRFEGLGGWVTAADLSLDGRFLAVLCESPQQSIWLFERPEEGGKFFSQARSVRKFLFFQGGQVEAMAFAKSKGSDEPALYLVNEEREMFRVSLSQFQGVEP